MFLALPLLHTCEPAQLPLHKKTGQFSSATAVASLSGAQHSSHKHRQASGWTLLERRGIQDFFYVAFPVTHS